MKTINIYEAKTNFSKLLELVANGESIVIANNGKPVADLGPHHEAKKIKLGLWQGEHAITYQDADIIGPDVELNKSFKDSQVMPDGSF
jgi:prevent-host-death family protein